jgi:hypothetical protein
MFASFAITSLALGLGLTAAVYSTVDVLFWQRPVFPRPAEVAVVAQHLEDGRLAWRAAVSRPDFEDLRRMITTMPDLAASSPVVAALDDGRRTVEFRGEAVTGNYFDLAQWPLFVGRGIQTVDDATASPALVLSHTFWQRHLGGETAIVGQILKLGGSAFTVVGVAGPQVETQL